MTLSYNETKVLIDAVLNTPPEKSRELLHNYLVAMKRREPEFYMGVIKYGPAMPYAAEQWFDLLSKIPDRTLRDEPRLMNKLSETQRQNLPRATFSAQ